MKKLHIQKKKHTLSGQPPDTNIYKYIHEKNTHTIKKTYAVRSAAWYKKEKYTYIFEFPKISDLSKSTVYNLLVSIECVLYRVCSLYNVFSIEYCIQFTSVTRNFWPCVAVTHLLCKVTHILCKVNTGIFDHALQWHIYYVKLHIYYVKLILESLTMRCSDTFTM